MSCNNVIKSTAVAATATELQITIPATTLADDTCYTIVIAQDIPDTAIGLPVSIIDGVADVPVWTCGFAEPVIAVQLGQLVHYPNHNVKEYVLPVRYTNTGIASNPAHFSVLRRLKPLCI